MASFFALSWTRLAVQPAEQQQQAETILDDTDSAGAPSPNIGDEHGNNDWLPSLEEDGEDTDHQKLLASSSDNGDLGGGGWTSRPT